VCFAKLGRIDTFTNALKAGFEDVETSWHGCYINDNDAGPSMTKTLIRHAVTADFETLLNIDQASFTGGVAYDAAELSYFMGRRGTETIVLEEDGTTVAFLILEVHRTRRSGTIVTLDVQETHRRKGYASQLLRRAESMLVDYGVEAYDLQVDIMNRPAIRFYRKHGFEAVRTLRNYYANGNDAYLMVKQL
jgi:[ribosomal protein S18]-alanine N-acetyltransferase